MAEVRIDINARDGASATMKKVGDEGESLGERMKKAAAGLYVLKTGFDMIVGAAKKVVDFGADLVKAWGVQEKAERDLIAAHNAMGEAGEKYIQDEKRIAAAIQDETGVGDEVTLQRMARAKALGVETNKLEQCAKGVVALTDVGMSEDAAVRAMAQAYAGNYAALERYIPAMKDAADETEKQTALNDFLTQGYDRQKETLGTVQGAWNALQGRIGDAKEVVGQAITENLNLSGILTKLGDKVNEVSGKMAEWCQTGGLARAIMFVKTFAEECKASITLGLAQLLKWYEGAKLYLVGGFKVAGEWSKGFWNSIVEGAKYAGEWCKYLWDRLTGKDARKPDFGEVKKAWSEMADRAAAAWDKEATAYRKSVEDIEAASDEVRRKRDANVKAIGEAYFQKMDEIREKSKETGEKIADAASTAGTKTVEAVEKTAKATVDNTRRAAAEAERELKRLQAEADKANAALAGMTDKKSRDADKEKRKQEREAKKQERENEKYQKRMKEYLRRWEDGGNLSQRQNRELNEWLKMREAAKNANAALAAAGGGNAIANAAGNIPGAPGQPAAAGGPNELQQILRHVASMDTTLDKCLRIG